MAQYTFDYNFWTKDGLRENIDPNVAVWQCLDEKFHREDGPAIEWKTSEGVKHYCSRALSRGTQYEHYIDNWNLARPEVETENTIYEFKIGGVMWFLDGKKLTLEEFIFKSPHFETDSQRLMFLLKWK